MGSYVSHSHATTETQLGQKMHVQESIHGNLAARKYLIGQRFLTASVVHEG